MSKSDFYFLMFLMAGISAVLAVGFFGIHELTRKGKPMKSKKVKCTGGEDHKWEPIAFNADDYFFVKNEDGTEIKSRALISMRRCDNCGAREIDANGKINFDNTIFAKMALLWKEKGVVPENFTYISDEMEKSITKAMLHEITGQREREAEASEDS